jgi:hypothetical protein
MWTLTTAHPRTPQYTVIGWEGNAPDSVVVLQNSAFGVFSLVPDHVFTTST